MSKPALQKTKTAIAAPRPEGTRCEVCGAAASQHSVDPLCWVCRRLKISAWRDVDLQMPAQE